jgi:glucose-6-phosphate 1-dehydrogenase
MNAEKQHVRLAIVIIGASGDLAARKIFPALFALQARGHLPADMDLFGFARTALTDKAFRRRIAPGLKCEELPGSVCEIRQQGFLPRCHYLQGAYDDPESFAHLRRQVASVCGPRVHCLYYFAIPPALFGQVAQSMRQAGIVQEETGPDLWNRVVVEKPFGRDRRSSDALTASLRDCFREEQTYRIDHYLGKEVIQNLMVLRFANAVFEPIWNRQYIRHVHISWSEDIPLAGRAGSFDSIGIIRDVMQNHLTQMLALVAMECPSQMDAQFVRDEKVRLLRQVVPLSRDRCVLGQYGAGTHHGRGVAGYREEPDVPRDSRTATYAVACFDIRSPRWRGVPFLISAAKGAATRCTEIRIHFKAPENDLFKSILANGGPAGTPLKGNELVIRVQPDEQIILRVVSKVPGFGFKLDTPNLDLSYREAYAGKRIGDAYENLLLDVIRGDRSLFIRDDELEAAWDIFTPLLHELDAGTEPPESYAFGSHGPEACGPFAQRFDIEDACEA